MSEHGGQIGPIIIQSSSGAARFHITMLRMLHNLQNGVRLGQQGGMQLLPSLQGSPRDLDQQVVWRVHDYLLL